MHFETPAHVPRVQICTTAIIEFAGIVQVRLKEREPESNTQTERQTDRDRQTDRQTDRDRDRERHSHTDRQKQTVRDTHTHRDREKRKATSKFPPISACMVFFIYNRCVLPSLREAV